MVHKYALFGYFIAVDTESGAVHVLSEAAYNMLDYFGLLLQNDNTPPESVTTDIRYSLAKYESSEVNEVYGELLELYKNGELFSAPALSAPPPAAGYIPVKAMCLHISHDCNLLCKYCFAGRGSFGGSKTLMSEETALAAVEFLMKNSGGRHNLEVDFFGGEPLMNFNTIKSVVAKTRELEKVYNKNVRFTITTNGVLLDDEKIDFINQHMTNAVLSLDGRPEVNDRMRTYSDRAGSYADLIPKFKALVAGRGNKSYYVRGTFTRYNLDFSGDVLHIADLGFKNVSVEPVVAPETADYSIREQDLPAVFKEYEKIASEMIKRKRRRIGEFEFFHFKIDLDGGPCVYKRAKGCGSGCEYVAVTPNGDIYPCHQFADNHHFRLGSLDQGITAVETVKQFAECNILTNPVCNGCWAKYYCGGGCAANNHNFAGTISKPYKIACEMEKKRVECAIAVKVVNALYEQKNMKTGANS